MEESTRRGVPSDNASANTTCWNFHKRALLDSHSLYFPYSTLNFSLMNPSISAPTPSISRMSWQDLGAARRRALAKSIPKEWLLPLSSTPGQPEAESVMQHETISQLLTSTEVKITETATPLILTRLKSGQWTSEAVTTAFCKRATIAHQLLNCTAEILFDEALAEARRLDDHYQRTGKPIGPLHGLPVSIKDMFDIAGHFNTAGVAARLGDVVSKDGLIVRLLREAGAIPFIITNVSQACLLVETTNNIYGTTLNPWNRALSPGGSSGGEAALVAFRGSPLGMGTDGGGSLRLPAAWTGIYTLKPSSARMPGGDRCLGYSDSNKSCNGPFANDIRTLRLFCEAILGSGSHTQPWMIDSSMVPIPWNPNVKAPRRLRLGILYDDGIIHRTPPVERCLAEAAGLLRSAGHEVIDLTGPEWAEMHRRGASIIFRMYTEEGGIHIREELEQSGEPLVPRVCSGWSETPATPKEIWLNHQQRNKLRDEYRAAMREMRLDAIISAPLPHPAPPHGQYITSASVAIYNLLDYPCCVIPFGRVDLEKDVASSEWYAQEAYERIPDFPYDRGDAEMKELCEYSSCFTGSCLLDLFSRQRTSRLQERTPCASDCNVAVSGGNVPWHLRDY